MAYIHVNRTDSSRRSSGVVLPEGPIPEYTRRARIPIGRRAAGQWIAAACRDPKGIACNATVEIAVCIRLRAINNRCGAVAAVAHNLLRKREHPCGHLGRGQHTVSCLEV